MAKELKDLFQEQVNFTADILSGLGVDLAAMDERERVKWTKEHVLSLVKELTEILDNLDWKVHRRQQEPLIQSNVLEEIIDVQKYLWGLVALWGVTYEEFEDAYQRKSFVVRDRLRQERAVLKRPLALVDLDGVLCKYPESFLEWAKQHYPNIEQLNKTKNPIIWEEAKKRYRSEGGKRTAIISPNALNLVNGLKAKGWSVVVFTYRPVHLYKSIEYDTVFWLQQHGFQYDKIIWASKEKSFYLGPGKLACDVFIDDDKEACLSVAHLPNIKVYCKGFSGSGVMGFADLKEVMSQIV